MKNLLILVPKNYEDTELIATIDVLKRQGITFDLVSIHNQSTESGLHFAIVKTIPINKLVNYYNYDGLFLPGGAVGNQYLINELIKKIILHFAQTKKLMCAICAGPETFFNLSLLENIKYTAHPGFADGPNKLDQPIVKDKNFLTGRDYEASLALGHLIAKVLLNKN